MASQKTRKHAGIAATKERFRVPYVICFHCSEMVVPTEGEKGETDGRTEEPLAFLPPSFLPSCFAGGARFNSASSSAAAAAVMMHRRNA